MQSYRVLEIYKLIKIGKKEVKIKRLTLGQWLEFIVDYRAVVLKKDKQALKEILKFIESKSQLTSFELGTICKEILVLNRSDYKGDSEKEEKPDWIYDVIAFFAQKCGWTKENILNLYLDEIKPLMLKIANLENKSMEYQADKIFIALNYAYSDKPEKYWDYVKKRDSLKLNIDENKLKEWERKNKERVSKNIN